MSVPFHADVCTSSVTRSSAVRKPLSLYSCRSQLQELFCTVIWLV
jgi:hypothetical protein